MRTLFLGLAGAAALAISSGASAVTVITPGAPGNGNQPGTSFQVSGNPFTGTDIVTAILGHTGLFPGSFTDDYQFTIGPVIPPLGGTQIGTGSGSLTTSITFGQVGGPADVNIASVLVNGFAATPTFFNLAMAQCFTPGVADCGAFEQFRIDGVPIVSGVLNHILVNGSVGGPLPPNTQTGLGSYSATATFQPGAVPEPATWALMLFGFAAVGWQLRRARPALMQIA